MPFKILVIALLILIVASLGKALFHLSTAGGNDGGKMAKALTARISLSLLLFVLLLIAYHEGWIAPTGPH